jgi:O-methyltransferase
MEFTVTGHSIQNQQPISEPMSENETHSSILFDQILEAISAGRRALLLCGLNPVTLRLVGLLTAHGLADRVAGIVDLGGGTEEEMRVSGIRVHGPDEIKSIEFDTLVITSEYDVQVALQELATLDKRMPAVIFAGDHQYDFVDPVFAEMVRSSAVKSKAGGYQHMLVHLFQALRYIAERGLQGHVAEFGMFRGGTTVFMAKVLAQFGHPARIFGFDTFGGFPPARSVLDLFTDEKYGFVDYDAVRTYCAPYEIELIPGDIIQTHRRLADVPLALCFFDTDNYSAARAALPLCVRQTVPGGILAFDHYYSPGWSRTVGEKIAVDEVLASSEFFHLHGTGIFIKR